jgi:hypothetical protein
MLICVEAPSKQPPVVHIQDPVHRVDEVACSGYEVESIPVTDGNHALCVTDAGVGFQIQSQERLFRKESP